MVEISKILMIVLSVIAALLSAAAAIAGYVLYSLGLARICKKLGTCNPILAWVPVVRLVVTAKVADAVVLKLDGKKKNLDKPTAISLILYVICICVMLLVAVVCALIAYLLAWSAVLPAVLVGVIAVVFYAIVLWYSVLWYIAFFRISRAFLPTWASWVLLVAQVLWPQITGIVMLVMSFFPVKGEGMIEGVVIEEVEQA